MQYSVYESDYFAYNKSDEYFSYLNTEISSRVFRYYFSVARSSDYEYFFRDRGEKFSTNTFVSEHFREGDFVSLGFGWSDSGGAYPNHSYSTFNFGGRNVGLFHLDDIFDFGEVGVRELLKWCDDALLLQSGIMGSSDKSEEYRVIENNINLQGWHAYEAETEMIKQFGFDNSGIELNFGTATGFAHVLGELSVTIPWHQFDFPLHDEIENTDFGNWIKKKRSEI